MEKIKACIEHEDYYTAMEFSILIKDYYEDEKKECLEKLINNVKSGSYENIKKMVEAQ